MPLVRTTYKPKLLFNNGHFNTIYCGLIRQVKGVKHIRERITLSDNDFLDLDWSFATLKTNKLIIILHGLEGHAQRPYMLGTAKCFNANHFDAVCVNFRGCSGKDNLHYRSYHSGATEDLIDVINHITTTKKYTTIVIKGFSLGGNLVLKYLGEGHVIPKQIKATMAVSVPCHLGDACIELHKFQNGLYAKRFLKHLKQRLKLKQIRHPDKISTHQIKAIKTLKAFDDVYTALAHGFKDADDYYKRCSSLPLLGNIKVPTLILNAKNDSFLSKTCYPYKEAKTNTKLFLETPQAGGHVGFYQSGNVCYNEQRALEFLK